MSTKLKEWRVGQNLKQYEAAKLLHCSASQLSEVESGKNSFSRNKIQELIDTVPGLTLEHFFNAPEAPTS